MNAESRRTQPSETCLLTLWQKAKARQAAVKAKFRARNKGHIDRRPSASLLCGLVLRRLRRQLHHPEHEPPRLLEREIIRDRERLVQAILDGAPADAVREKIGQLERCRAELEPP